MSDLFLTIGTAVTLCGMYVLITCMVSWLIDKDEGTGEFFINAWTVGMVLFSCFGTLIYKMYLRG